MSSPLHGAIEAEFDDFRTPALPGAAADRRQGKTEINTMALS